MVVSGVLQIRDHAMEAETEDDLEIDNGSTTGEETDDESEGYGSTESEGYNENEFE